jgi:hypothetical protein
MTQQQTASAPKDSVFLGVLCAFVREIQLLVAAQPRWASAVNPVLVAA